MMILLYLLLFSAASLTSCSTEYEQGRKKKDFILVVAPTVPQEIYHRQESIPFTISVTSLSGCSVPEGSLITVNFGGIGKIYCNEIEIETGIPVPYNATAQWTVYPTRIGYWAVQVSITQEGKEIAYDQMELQIRSQQDQFPELGVQLPQDAVYYAGEHISFEVGLNTVDIEDLPEHVEIEVKGFDQEDYLVFEGTHTASVTYQGRAPYDPNNNSWEIALKIPGNFRLVVNAYQEGRIIDSKTIMMVVNTVSQTQLSKDYRELGLAIQSKKTLLIQRAVERLEKSWNTPIFKKFLNDQLLIGNRKSVETALSYWYKKNFPSQCFISDSTIDQQLEALVYMARLGMGEIEPIRDQLKSSLMRQGKNEEAGEAELTGKRCDICYQNFDCFQGFCVPPCDNIDHSICQYCEQRLDRAACPVCRATGRGHPWPTVSQTTKDRRR